MIFNIQFQICGFVLMLMVLFFYFTNNTLQVYSERAYSYLLVAVAVCLLLDISSVIAINFKDSLPKLLLDLICKGYTMSICIVAFLTRMYVLMHTTHKHLTQKQKLYHAAPLFVCILLSLVLPLQYHLGKGKIYSYGIVVSITYLTVSYYLLLSVYCIIRWRKVMSKNHFHAISFLLSAWILTAIIQFLKNEWLLVGFAMATAMVFMYFCLENPLQNLDNLTGVFNQSAYYKYIHDLCSQKRNFTLVVLSIEDMDFINDTFGINNADMFLQEIANYLNLNTRGKVFRNLGNRFSLILEEEIHEVEPFIEKIRNRFHKPWKIANFQFKAPICIIEMQASSCDFIPEKIMELSRYFVSKAERGNLFQVNEEHIREIENLKSVEKTLRRTIKNKTVQVYYQPIYSLEEKRYISAEALARITDESGNFINPEIFIHVAEQKGMILELGMLIFDEVCKFIRMNTLKELGLKYIEINLSVVQCMQETLAEELIAVMMKYSIPPDFINFEITETAAVNSSSNLIQNMNRLIEKGVTFSLDDYGTGYSNLSYIIELPIKLIKIDKSIAQAYCNASKVRIALESTILMIKKLNLHVVAEGIETEEQLEKMNSMGIDFIQGFYFSKPLNKLAFLEELRMKI